jgi:hypothetical protein
MAGQREPGRALVGSSPGAPCRGLRHAVSAGSLTSAQITRLARSLSRAGGRRLPRRLRSGLSAELHASAVGSPRRFIDRTGELRHNFRQNHLAYRDLVLEVDPALYPQIEGSTDTEVFFHLALTYGLEDDPPAAVERAVGLIEDIGRKHVVEHPVQMTVATTDGSGSGRSAIPARAGRGRCSSAPTPAGCRHRIQRTLSSPASARRPG